MASFSIANTTTPAGTAQAATAATYVPLLAVAASSGNFTNTGAGTGPLRRGKLYDILIGTNGTPADNFMEFSCHRVTIGTTLTWLGTISSVSSAYVLDYADGAPGPLLISNASAGSSTIAAYIAQPWYVGINQRASYRWVAAPGSEIVYPANSSGTGNNGLMLSARSAGYTGTATGTLFVTEL